MTQDLETTRTEFMALRERCRSLDGDAEGSQTLEAQLSAISVDLALSMLGADHHFDTRESEAFNAIFALELPHDEIADLAGWLHQRDSEPPMLFERLDRFLPQLSTAAQSAAPELPAAVLDFLLRLGQIMALIDEDYHPQEDRFHQSLVARLRLAQGTIA